MFSFYLSRNDGGADGRLTLGGAYPSLYAGDINYHKVVDEYYWELKADNILVDGKNIGLCRGGCKVIADTGTSLITGPSDDLYTILDSLNIDEDCANMKNLPTLSFVLDGV